jgi:hypothetical protein
MLTYVALAVADGGETTNTAALANTWAQFSTGSGPANVMTWDGRIMSYYTAPFGACATNSANLVENLGPSGPSTSGQCGAFAYLLESALAANGIDSEWTNVGTVDGSNMVIKTWGLSPSPTYASSPPSGYPQFIYKLILNTGDSGGGMDPPPPGGFGDLTNDMGVPGQNEPGTPPVTPSEKVFGLHFIVEIPIASGNQYHDPSYGVTYPSPAGFESQAVQGYARQIGSDLGTNNFHFRVAIISGLPVYIQFVPVSGSSF